MVVCVECMPADKPWDVVSVTRRSSGVAPRACVRVYARALVPPNLYIHTYTFWRRNHPPQQLEIMPPGLGYNSASFHPKSF